MTTLIGEGLLQSRTRLVLAGLIGLAVVATDLILIRAWPDYPWSAARAVLPLVVLVFYLVLLRGERASLGLTLVPIPGYRYWLKAVLVLGGIIGLLVGAGMGLWWLAAFPLPIYRVPPADIGQSLLRMCVYAPLVEECIYRLALCVPLVALGRPTVTILVGGLLFGFLHVVYGNPAPDNLIAGFFLVWAYLRSGSLLVSVGLHSLGNLCALSFQVAAWYWLS